MAQLTPHTPIDEIPWFLSMEQAAGVIGCDPRTVKKLIDGQQLPALRQGRTTYIPKTELLRMRFAAAGPEVGK
jgi:excisionase family DNA binding protein